MKALQFDKTGSLDDLKIVGAPRPRPASGDALVQVKGSRRQPE